ncbi:hypothetical protein GCM10012275_51890 [Longimycelium tulufanense]|uniref:Uncharacterized protein n=1 Tax=Longimycelium tulufanense TaxID=907463 RepID=A0A8J3FW83_9PSEU|nr:class I SAM-dependent methyltransferase [Longimycelium tulufanense]GGM74822.1 hypothetical protein GCM10012275_51890 [Longimycelium tulufanense]
MNFDVDPVDTRHDPHAQARAARQSPLLLHSMTLFREIFEVVFARKNISTVVEVGVESGQASSMYLELGAVEVYCVDPVPSDELRTQLDQFDALHLVEKLSPDVLAELPPADLYVLDGDHNYSVVRREFEWIVRNVPDAVVAFHDLLWPCGRRDLYYEPSPLPLAERYPSSTDGPTVWHDELTPAGFVGAGAFTTAEKAGGERNGVLTAVEDVLAESGDPGWCLELVPAVFGMGVAFRRDQVFAGSLRRALAPYTNTRLLAAMENNRIALYTRVLQMQYDAERQTDEINRLVAENSELRQQIERNKTAADPQIARLSAELRVLRQENQRLARAVANRPFTRPSFGPSLLEAVRMLGRPRRK